MALSLIFRHILINMHGAHQNVKGGAVFTHFPDHEIKCIFDYFNDIDYLGKVQIRFTGILYESSSGETYN